MATSPRKLLGSGRTGLFLRDEMESVICKNPIRTSLNLRNVVKIRGIFCLLRPGDRKPFSGA